MELIRMSIVMQVSLILIEIEDNHTNERVLPWNDWLGQFLSTLKRSLSRGSRDLWNCCSSYFENGPSSKSQHLRVD